MLAVVIKRPVVARRRASIGRVEADSADEAERGGGEADDDASDECARLSPHGGLFKDFNLGGSCQATAPARVKRRPFGGGPVCQATARYRGENRSKSLVSH